MTFDYRSLYTHKVLGATRLVALTLAALFAFSSFSHAQDTATAARLLQLTGDEVGTQPAEIDAAIEAFKKRDGEGTLNAFKEACKKNAYLPPAEVLLGKLHFLARDVRGGRIAMELAIKEHPGDPEPYIVLADIAFGQGRVADADALFEKGAAKMATLTADPKRVNKLTIRLAAGRSAVHEARAQWESAEEYLKKWSELDPQEVNAKTRLARVLFMRAEQIVEDNKDGDDAAKKAAQDTATQLRASSYAAFGDAYKLKDDITRPEISMASLYEAHDQHTSAAKLMALAAERMPEHKGTQLSVARWALATGQPELAKKHAAIAGTIDGADKQVRLLQGVIARFQDDFAGAERWLQPLHDGAPDDFGFSNQLVLALCEQGDQGKLTRAMDMAELNARKLNDIRKPIGREAAVVLAWVYQAQDKGPQALNLVRQVLRVGDVSDESAYFAAAVLAKNAEKPAALLLMKRHQNPKSQYPHRAAADALFAKLSKDPEAELKEPAPADPAKTP